LALSSFIGFDDKLHAACRTGSPLIYLYFDSGMFKEYNTF